MEANPEEKPGLAGEKPPTPAAAPKLGPVASQQVIAVLEECIGRLEVLGGLTPDVLHNKEATENLAFEEISRIIATQKRLELTYEGLIEQRTALRLRGMTELGVANFSKIKELQNEIDRTSHELRHATNVLCINLERRGAADVSGNLLKIQNERQSYAHLIRQLIEELQENGTFNVLETTVEAEAEEKKAEVLVRKQETENTILALRLAEQFLAEQAELDQDHSKQQEQIFVMQQQLADSKVRSAIQSKVMKKEVAARADCNRRVYSASEKKLEDNVINLKKRLMLEDKVNEQICSYLEEKNSRLQQEVNDWMNRYDLDTEAKLRLKESLKEKKDKTLIELYDLRTSLRKVKEEVKARRAVLADKREKKSQEDKENRAATLIQAVFRSHRTRRLQRRRKKRGKKGRGGKGRR